MKTGTNDFNLDITDFANFSRLPDTCAQHNTVVSGPLSWHVYGIYAIVFSFSATHLHFKVLDRRTHLWFEPECSGSFERSLRGQFCSSTNGNIACLVTCDAILLFYMDELIRVYLSKSSPTRDKCFEERKVPSLPSGRRFCSVEFYGQHLFLAETPVRNNQLTLHVTDVNQLINGNDEPVWTTKLVDIDQSVRNYFGDDFSDVTLQMSCSRIKNKLYK